MHILLFIIYAAVLGWIITRRPFFRDIQPGMLLAFFALRIAAGCLHTWVAYKYYPNHGDIWLFFQDSFVTRHLLFTDFHAFWADNSSLAYLPHNLIEWTHVLFNFLSFDNFYINTLFFTFLTFGGHIALFRVFYERFGHDTLSAASMLLLPSVLFWTSCMHTEGIIYAMLGWLFYTLHRSFRTGWTTGRILLGLALTGLTIFFRPAIAIGLLPALAWWTAAEMHLRRRTLLIAAAALILLISLLSWANPPILALIPHTLSSRQQEYQSLTGNSRIPLPLLEPTWNSLWHVLPDALFNGLFQPTPGAGGQKIYLFFSLELYAIWILALLALIRAASHKRKAPAQNSRLAACSLKLEAQSSQLAALSSKLAALSPQLTARSSLLAACLLLALPGMLLIGYIIPFVGAIVRYRSIYLPFLLAPCMATLQASPPFLKLKNALTTYIFK
ncbi:hypothetical protein Q4E93_16155 [Flavitalea sp. BT771]|uniref:hypothetical protein n=1 Tax=Flavitalea sp. BT771 TaxID=3063329 RepID=UPI0026E26735|nr:hypothetical protein [Flavitalea sp. BT771]MDO6432136.1 hypothetical protein [Flavitalea sp. BT771]MDV6221045.1 hypothetical protein [Flavitalea sp. BT771]